MDRKQLIAQIQRETGTRITPDDPILDYVSINEALLDEGLNKVEAVVKAHTDRMAAVSTEMVANTEKVAERLIADAGVWLEARMRAAGDAAAERVIRDLRGEREKAEHASRVAVKAAWATAAVSTVLALLAAGYLISTVV